MLLHVIMKERDTIWEKYFRRTVSEDRSYFILQDKLNLSMTILGIKTRQYFILVADENTSSLFVIRFLFKSKQAVNVSSTYLSWLFTISSCLFFCLFVGFINLGVHAVHALRPLPIDHILFLLTSSTTKSVDEKLYMVKSNRMWNSNYKLALYSHCQ